MHSLRRYTSISIWPAGWLVIAGWLLLDIRLAELMNPGAALLRSWESSPASDSGLTCVRCSDLPGTVTERPGSEGGATSAAGLPGSRDAQLSLSSRPQAISFLNLPGTIANQTMPDQQPAKAFWREFKKQLSCGPFWLEIRLLKSWTDRGSSIVLPRS